MAHSYDVTSVSVEPVWVLEQTKERLKRELEAEEKELEEQLMKARKREAAAKRAALARVRKRPASVPLFVHLLFS